MINVRGVKKAFADNTVLSGIDLDVQRGEIVTLIGPSGAGKTTLLRTLNWLDAPDSGVITIDGETIDASNARKQDIRRIRSKTAMVFQHYNLFANRTALQNVTESLLLVKKMNKTEAIQKGKRLLDRVGLSDKYDTYPAFLSGGQQQRVGIARALAIDPQVMLFDEPTSALDPEWVGEVLAVISEIAAEGMTMLIVSHEMQFVRNVSSRILFLDHGKILEDSTPEQVLFGSTNDRITQFLQKANLC